MSHTHTHGAFTCLTAKETNPAQTEISQLQVTMLVNQKVIRLQVTAVITVRARPPNRLVEHTGEQHRAGGDTRGPAQLQQCIALSTLLGVIPRT